MSDNFGNNFILFLSVSDDKLFKVTFICRWISVVMQTEAYWLDFYHLPLRFN